MHNPLTKRYDRTLTVALQSRLLFKWRDIQFVDLSGITGDLEDGGIGYASGVHLRLDTIVQNSGTSS